MNNRNKNYERTTNENEQDYQLPRPQQSRVVEIPVIHCPIPPNSSQSNNTTSGATNFQHSIPVRQFQSFQQPTSLFSNNFDSSFDTPFDSIDSSGRSRRAFQDPNLDDFFNPSFTTRDIFTEHPQSLLNRFGPERIIHPRSTLSPSRVGSAGTSPKISNFNRKPEPQEFTIPVNYVKSNFETCTEPTADLPTFSAYKQHQPSFRSEQTTIIDSDKNNQQSNNNNKIDRSPSPPKLSKVNQHQQASSNSGNSHMGSSNQKQKSQEQASPNPPPPPPPPPQQQSSFVHSTPETSATTAEFQPKLPKTSQEKIDIISTKLYNLENDVNNYSAPKDHKKDKAFLLLEESLTQCLLQLDEIDRDDDKINQIRKRLIRTTHRIIEVLESKLTNNSEIHKNDDIVSNNNDDSNISNLSDNKSQENLKKEDVDSKNMT